MTAETFPARLKRLRTLAKLTQVELGQRAGVHVGTIKKWEAGEREPSYGQIPALAAALRVEPGKLFQSRKGLP